MYRAILKDIYHQFKLDKIIYSQKEEGTGVMVLRFYYITLHNTWESWHTVYGHGVQQGCSLDYE